MCPQIPLNKLEKAGVPVYITAYSEGTGVATKAFEAGARLFGRPTIKYAGSPVGYSQAKKAVERAGGRLEYIPTSWADPINLVQSPNPFKMFGGAFGLVKDTLTGFKNSAHDLNNYLQPQNDQ